MIRADSLPLGPFPQRLITAEWHTSTTYALIGRNGIGKTTLLRSLLRGGSRVSIDGKPLRSARDQSQWISWLPQEMFCPFDYSVKQVMLMGRHAFHAGHPHASDHRICEHWARYFGLIPLFERPVTQLSTGERRIVFLAAAVARETPVLLLDEPLANLDPLNQSFLIESFRALREQGRCLIIAMHEWHYIPDFCDHIDQLTEHRLERLPPHLSVQELRQKVSPIQN